MLPWLRFSAVLAGLLCVGQALAQATFTWTGGAPVASGSTYTTNSFETGGNWSGGSAPTTGANLVFGASTDIGFGGEVDVIFKDPYQAASLTFSGNFPLYVITGGPSLGIGAGGVSVSNTGHALVYLGYGPEIQLLANQTWLVDGNVEVYSPVTGAFGITKTGSGFLVFNNSNNSFTGGVNVQAGTLYLGGNSNLVGGVVTAGPIGTGTLTLGSGTTLLANTYSDLTLDNTLLLGTGVTIGSTSDSSGIKLGGTVTPLNAATTVIIGSGEAIHFNGTLSNVSGGAASSFTFTSAATNTSPGIAVLNGVNTYTGTTTADGAAVVFFSSGALASTTGIAAVNQGYVSAAFSGGVQAIIGKIGNQAAFAGALGFDTDPSSDGGPNVFSDTLNLSGFSSNHTVFLGLGTQTRAILTGSITPPAGGDYVFGGGNGVLQVQSTLGAVADVRVQSNAGDPLTVYFQGNNAYTGDLRVDHSVVILDSANALPGESTVKLGSDSYVGATENFSTGAFPLINAVSSYNSTSVIGFDTTAANLPAGRTLGTLVDLSGFTGITLGTATHVRLSGTILAPAFGELKLTGVRGGWLTIDSSLGGGNVGSLIVGGAAPGFSDRGYVELTSSASDFAGGTTLRSGYLLLGADSMTEGPAVLSGPLGTGTLTFDAVTNDVAPALATTTDDLYVANNIHFTDGTTAQFGVYRTLDSKDPAYAVQAYKQNGFTLAGNLTGNPDTVTFVGKATYTLSGDNSGLHTSEFDLGGSYLNGTPLVIAASDTALGATDSMVCLAAGADLKFTTLSPSIGSIMGGTPPMADMGDSSFIVLAPGSTLTINQTQDAILYANLGGTPKYFDGESHFTDYARGTPDGVNAALVKNGGATLTLAGQSTYGGGTTINAGRIIAASSTHIDDLTMQIASGPLGTGPITLNGGQLSFANSVSIANPIVFGASGGTLSGNVTFESLITAGSKVILAPGNSPGQMTFASGLTFASGGTFSVDLYDLAGTPGTGYDTLNVTGGAFAITATTPAPFTLRLTSLATLQQAGLLGTTPAGPASLLILQAPDPITDFNGSNIVIDATNFSSSVAGTFSLSVGGEAGDQLLLNFTPVPEPSTYALLALGLGLIAVTARRRR